MLVPLIEAFEPAHLAETSNEDPRLCQYIRTLLLYAIVIHINLMGIYRCYVSDEIIEVFEVSMSHQQSVINA